MVSWHISKNTANHINTIGQAVFHGSFVSRAQALGWMRTGLLFHNGLGDIVLDDDTYGEKRMRSSQINLLLLFA